MQWSLILVFLMGQCCLITCQLYEYRFIDLSKNWSEAQQYCRKHHTDLATVSNMTDMSKLFQLENWTEAWIGLNKTAGTNRTWHWSLPGVEFNDSNVKWKSGEPDDGNGNGPENCGKIKKDLSWFDYPCNDADYFLCYNESDPVQKFYLITENKNWLEAQRYCRENHTDLVSGVNQLQDVNLNLTTQECNTAECRLFFGLFRDNWRWSDGSSFSFRYWGAPFTSAAENQNTNNCTAMRKDSKTWNSFDCNERKPFFCYDDKVILIKEQMNWENALYYCREYHGDLVTITNLDEQRWVQEKTKNATTPYVWTGLRYTCTLDFWFWVSNQAVTYTNWASGQDGNDCDMSGAMETGGEHKWLKKNDNDKMNFICSKSAKK
ncbi:C-type mannose receptor 2-like [Melanotaenia boesemani]|uniref:C-type mannose receptor 2-like n=1 Tax=Melanotaenia boesemani TaxID=1250792 RepID=UPI001C055C51|nr:C-type mannose receptor 2-like [Melanotaenia boesemani]